MNSIIDSRKDIIMNKKGGIFAVAARAKQRIQAVGADKVINSTLGNGMDDEGKPFIIPTFVKVIQDMMAENPAKLCGYTPPGGLPELNNLYPQYILDGVTLPDDIYIKSIPTHGGSGGLSISMLNLSEKSVITHFPFWPNYNLIAKQNGRSLQGFYLLDDKLNFDLDSFKQTVRQVAESEKRLFILINTPYCNPTGSTITDAEWNEIGKFLATFDIPKTLALDLAYVDFGKKGKNPGELKFLESLLATDPKLNLVLIPSASKSFMAYGWRLGAAIFLTRSQQEADDWYNVMEGTMRGSNSNNTTAPQLAMARILADKNLIKLVDQERQAANQLIQARFEIFATEAAKQGLKISKPTGGYFTIVYMPNASQVAAKLEEQNIFTIPIANPESLRISICALTKDECSILPQKIARML